MHPNPTPAVKIIRPGIYCAIQDFGRFGFRHLGVPCSGASDRQSMIYVNFLLQNPIDAPVLEIFGQNVEIEIINPVKIAISGAQSQITIDGFLTDFSEAIDLIPGQIIKIEKLIKGAITYMGITGGFYAEQIMGSTSTLGGTHLKPLSKNEILYTNCISKSISKSQGKLKPLKVEPQKPLQVVCGPEFDMLDNFSQKLLFKSAFIISKDSSRMGFRLIGEKLTRTQNYDILTSAVAPGVVQLLPNGHLIILMRDCQTTGGYPRILIVNEPDINQLAQRSPGHEVLFVLN